MSQENVYESHEDLFDDLQIKYHKEHGEFHKQKGEDLSKIKELKQENKKLREQWTDKERALQADNESLRGVIKELQEKVPSTVLIPDQAYVKHECGEQKNQLAVENEDLGMEEPPFIYLRIEPTFYEQIQKLEKQHALPFQLDGHELEVLTKGSFNDLVTELNEMKRKVAEQQDQFDSINNLIRFCEEKETKIVEMRKMCADRTVVDKQYQDRIQFLGRKKNELETQLFHIESDNNELKSERDIKSEQIEKSNNEISSLKGTIAKNKKITSDIEEKLRKIFNSIMDYPIINRIGKKTTLK